MEVDYKGFLEVLGKRIKQLRKDRGWSLRDMVIHHGYHDSQWRKYESGGGLTVLSLLRIAALYEISISKLLNGLAEFPALNLSDVTEKPGSKKPVKSTKSAQK
jgi:transcriptional regulator with XRE-family HTH domain